MATQKKILFKDLVKWRDYPELIAKLDRAMNEGENALKLLLLGTDTPELYSDHGSYKYGQHNKCGGLGSDTFTEKRLCKCIYYHNGQYCKQEECDACLFEDRFTIVGKHKITEYEVPSYYYVPRVGKIDLIIDDIYATEIKPYKGNNEFLLRMVAEVMTYTLGFPSGKYKKAIAFFEDTHQSREYANIDPSLKNVLKKADITVFCFEKRGENAYEIVKV